MNDLMTRSFLNYVDLKKQAAKDLQSEDLAQTMKTEDEQSLCFFLQEAGQIKIRMAEITAQLQDLQALNEESKSVKSSKDLQELRNRIDSHTTSTSRMVIAVRSRIETLSKSNSDNLRTSAADRTKTTITNSLKRRFKDITRDFAILRDRITITITDHHHQQQETLRKPDPAIRNTEMLQIDRSKTTECERRNEAVMDIERSLDRLQQVFLDMAVLVEEQEDQIDDIEKNMASSGRSISGGTNSFYYANQRKKDRRRWYWIGGALGLVILLLCLVAALSS